MNKSKIALTTALLSLPIFGINSTATAQENNRVSNSTIKTSSKVFLKVEIKDRCVAVGSADGKTVFKNSKNECFYLDPKTGDMKFVSSDYYIKISNADAKMKFSGTHIKFKNEVSGTVQGLDKSGNAILENSKGELFYLDPKTGDMKFVK